MVGMAIPDGPPLGSALEAKFESLATNVFFPISIAVMTMKGDIIRVLYAFDDISFNIFLVGFTLVLKWTASFVPCLIFKLPTRESIIIAMIMNYKGFVDLCFVEGAFSKGVINLLLQNLNSLYMHHNELMGECFFFHTEFVASNEHVLDDLRANERGHFTYYCESTIRSKEEVYWIRQERRYASKTKLRSQDSNVFAQTGQHLRHDLAASTAFISS